MLVTYQSSAELLKNRQHANRHTTVGIPKILDILLHVIMTRYYFDAIAAY